MPDAPYSLPENCTDPRLLKKAVFAVLGSKPGTRHFVAFVDHTDHQVLKRAIFAALTGDLSFHEQIKRAMTGAGFTVSRVEKHWFHDCWEIRLARGPSLLEDSVNQIKRRIRQALRQQSICYDPDTFVVGIEGRRLKCAFVCKLGMVGAI